MGLSRADVGDHSFWTFNAALDGWRRAHETNSRPPPPTDEQHDYLIAKYG
jgi:hypothetical protein